MPEKIEISGYIFEFQIFKNGKNDIRVGYILTSHESWFNRFTKSDSDHLVLSESASTDEDMMTSLQLIRQWLKNHSLC